MPCRSRCVARHWATWCRAVSAEPSSSRCVPGTRMGGHSAQGRVDGVGEARPAGSGGRGRKSCPSQLRRPSCATRSRRGRSPSTVSALTVVSITDELFSVTVVPHTLAVTNLGALDIGGRVNLEADLFAKYVERLALREASLIGHMVNDRRQPISRSCCRSWKRFKVRGRQGSDQRHPRRPHGGRGRLRRPRERGRPGDGRRVRDSPRPSTSWPPMHAGLICLTL